MFNNKIIDNMKDSIKLSITLNADCKTLYNAWLNSREHSKFTGSPAKIDPKPKGKFTAWDGYIFGKNITLDPYHKIIQAWRTTEFTEADKDSMLEILFVGQGKKTILTLKHTGYPEGQGPEYKKGWIEFYLDPMKKYFNHPRTLLY
jgi:activator of HSP90 ATPase